MFYPAARALRKRKQQVLKKIGTGSVSKSFPIQVAEKQLEIRRHEEAIAALLSQIDALELLERASKFGDSRTAVEAGVMQLIHDQGGKAHPGSTSLSMSIQTPEHQRRIEANNANRTFYGDEVTHEARRRSKINNQSCGAPGPAWDKPLGAQPPWERYEFIQANCIVNETEHRLLGHGGGEYRYGFKAPVRRLLAHF